MTNEKCSNCESEKLLFKALVDANCNFNDWLDDGKNNEAFCEDCGDWFCIEYSEQPITKSILWSALDDDLFWIIFLVSVRKEDLFFERCGGFEVIKY